MSVVWNHGNSSDDTWLDIFLRYTDSRISLCNQVAVLHILVDSDSEQSCLSDILRRTNPVNLESSLRAWPHRRDELASSEGDDGLSVLITSVMFTYCTIILVL